MFDCPDLLRVLVSHDDFAPYPTAANRKAWDGLDATWRDNAIASGEKAMAVAWPHVTATQILRYVRDGSRDPHQEPVFLRRRILHDLVLAECAEGDGRFVDPIIDSLWSTCEESTWCWSAHLHGQACGVGLPDVTDPVFDLGAGETAALLAWTRYLLRDAIDGVSPLIADRIALELKQRIFDPCLGVNPPGWMIAVGRARPMNNWTPWCVSNGLAAMLLTEPDNDRRRESVRRAAEALQCFVDGYDDDGACDEGPGYWTHAAGRLIPCLELLRLGTGGALNLLHHPKVQAMARFIQHVNIGDGWYFNFNDGSARPPIEPTLLNVCGHYTDCAELVAMARHANHIEKRMPHSLTLNLMNLFAIAKTKANHVATTTKYLPSIHCMIARSDHLFVAAKGGHNGESHNHNDVGNFVVFAGNCPLLIDVGVASYTRKTFSADRYSLWYMQSQWHNVPTINGVMQSPGSDQAARGVQFTDEGNIAALRMDIANAYPPEANVNAWLRTVSLDRDVQEVTVADAYELAGAVREIACHLLTPSRVVIGGEGELRLESVALPGGLHSASAVIAFDPAWAVTIVSQATEDERLSDVWGDVVNRITFTRADPPAQGELTLRITACDFSKPSSPLSDPPAKA